MFLVYSFYYVEVCSFHSCFLESFFFLIINGCWILSKAFSSSIEIITWFLSLSFLMWCMTLIDFWILWNPFIPGIKPTWSWCMIFLICFWILFARILLRIFASRFVSNISLQFSLLWHFCHISSFLPSLVALGVELGYLLDIFLVSWGKPVLL